MALHHLVDLSALYVIVVIQKLLKHEKVTLTKIYFIDRLILTVHWISRAGNKNAKIHA